MGTSIDNPGQTGGAYTDYKRAASQFATYGGSDRAQRTLAGLVKALAQAAGGAGAAGAAAGARAGAASGQALGAFVAGGADGGLEGGLEAVGLGDLVGRGRLEVLSALIDRIAGEGDDEEAVAARSAVLDVLAEIVPEGDDPDEIGELELGPDAVRDALLLFLTRYIYNRVGAILEQRLAKLEDDALIEARDQEMRDYIRSLVELRLRDLDPLTVDWSGEQGRKTITSVLEGAFRLMEADEDGNA